MEYEIIMCLLKLQAQLLDVVCFNRYNAWYSDGGQLAVIAVNVENEARAWYQTFRKPIIMAEYGGDTMPGLHRVKIKLS
jgi:beta-glucuronidase